MIERFRLQTAELGKAHEAKSEGQRQCRCAGQRSAAVAND